MVSPATTTVEIRASGFSVVMEPGGFIGAALEQDNRRNAGPTEIKGFDVLTGATGAYGMRWEEALKAVICEYDVQARDIAVPEFTEMERDLQADMFGSGPEGFEWDTRDLYDSKGKLVHKTSIRGKWQLVAPDWNLFGCLAWQQGEAGEGDPNEKWYLSSRTPIPAGWPFLVLIQRDAIPTDQAEEGIDYFTAIRFGGMWELTLSRWASTRLRKRAAGRWTEVATWEWDTASLFRDESASRALGVWVFPIDGKLLFKTTLGEASYLYEERNALVAPEAPISFHGNGGRAIFGLHEVLFDDRTDNLAVQRQESRLDYRPADAPTPVVIGSVPEGATALVRQVIGGTPQAPGTGTAFRLGMQLAPTADGRETPAVRMIGLDYPTVAIAPEEQWADVSDRFEEGTTAQEYLVEQRRTQGVCNVRLSNRGGDWTTLRGARSLRVLVGRDGIETPRFSGIGYLEEAGRIGVEGLTASFQGLDPISAMLPERVGHRRPLDGLKVAQAIGLGFGWMGLLPEQIGTIYDSGSRLPISVYGEDDWEGTNRPGVLDRAAAAAMPEPESTFEDLFTWLMGFDAGTYLFWNPMVEQVNYLRLEMAGDPTYTYYQTDEEHLSDILVARERAARRPRLQDIYTRVRVEGQDRKSGDVLIATAWDRDRAQDPTAIGFRAGDRTHSERDSALGDMRQVALRCRYRFDWGRRLREERSWDALGNQHLDAPQKLGIVETGTGEAGDYYLLGLTDQIGQEGQYMQELDTAAWAMA